MLVADGWVLQALETVLLGIPYVEGSIQEDDTLVVYAHALVESTSDRTEAGGLRTLCTILGTSTAPCRRIYVLGFLPARSYGPLSVYAMAAEEEGTFLPLPCSREELLRIRDECLQ